MLVDGRLDGRALSLPADLGTDERGNGNSRRGGKAASAVSGRPKSIAVSGRSFELSHSAPATPEVSSLNGFIGAKCAQVFAVDEAGLTKYSGGLRTPESVALVLRVSLPWLV
jgi:hypothetical protein